MKLKPLETAGRNKLFGKFSYENTPVPGNPEKIKITDRWAKDNLVKVTFNLPKLGTQTAWFHKLVAPKFLAAIKECKEAGVLEDILTWNGSYSARLVRGTKFGTLSSHSWGSAFDINAKWNGLGKEPAPLGTEGSVLRLVPIFEKYGFFHGANFTRSDPMHFELCEL